MGKLASDLISLYIKRKNIRKTHFANKVGITYQFLNLVLKGDRKIGEETAKKIERATGGEIKKEWLVFPEDYKEEIQAYLEGKQLEEVK